MMNGLSMHLFVFVLVYCPSSPIESEEGFLSDLFTAVSSGTRTVPGT